MNSKTFNELGLSKKLCQLIREIGYQSPTPIQSEAIPHLLKGSDLLGIAQTGTGKTAAFSLPLLDKLVQNNKRARPKKPSVLVLSPTRELAQQIHDEIQGFSRNSGLKLTCIFGGVGQRPQVSALSKGVDIVVATPGRILDLMNQRHVDLSDLSHLVLDEADRLLDMGFIHDVKRIVSHTPKSRQSLLFSATMPKEVTELAKSMLNNPVRVDIAPKQIAVEAIEQSVVQVDNGHKRQVLVSLLHDNAVSRAIVFTRTKHGANRVAQQLLKAGISAIAIHGNKSQNARRKALQEFKDGDSWVLVATDIAARGIDIPGISHVINFELPHEPESYVHRIGRTGRAGATGVAWSLVDPSENKRLKAVERLTRKPLTVLELDIELEPLPVLHKVNASSGSKTGQQTRSRRSGQSGANKAEKADKSTDANRSKWRNRRRKTQRVA